MTTRTMHLVTWILALAALAFGAVGVVAFFQHRPIVALVAGALGFALTRVARRVERVRVR